jgi:hypothetical protein
MDGTELHVQASIWNPCLVTEKRIRHGVDPTVIAWPGCRTHPRNARSTALAVLIMEGEAPDRSNGGAMAVDALFRAVLARGLKLTTDLEHLQMHPIPGWRLQVDNTGAVTLAWPHPTPLLSSAHMELPSGWCHAATAHGLVMVLVGCGLGLHQHAGDGNAHPIRHLEQAAETGHLAAAAVQAALPADIASDADDPRVTRPTTPILLSSLQ